MEKKSKRPKNLSSLASKLFQMIGRIITQPDASNSGERWESKQLVHEDDRRQLFEAKDASALETKLEDTHFGNTHLCNTPVLVVLGILWPHGPNFDHISQIPNVTSYLGQKDCTLLSKMVLFGKFKRGSGFWTADEQGVCKMVLTDFFLIFNYTVGYSLCSMPEKVTRNFNICLF